MMARREQLAMSQNKAAKAFGGSRTTWINWEKDEVQPERFNYVRIETTLRWQPGSVKAILEGGEPTPIRDHSPPDDLSVMLEELGIDPGKWRRVPQSTKDAITTAYRIDRERRMKESQRPRNA